MTSSRNVLLGVACVAFGGICWGFSGTCAQLLSTNYGVPPTWMMCVRMALASVLYLAACLVMDRKRLIGLLRDARSMLELVVFAFLGVILVQLCYLNCISYTNAGTATMFERTGLIVIMAVTCLSARRLPRKREVVGLVLALGGMLCITTKGDLSTLSIPPQGVLWGLGSAVSLAFYTLLPGKLLARWGSLPVVSLAMSLSALLTNVTLQPWNMGVELVPEVVGTIVAMAVVGTFFAYLVFLQGLKLAGPVLTGMVGCVEPVAAFAIAAVWLGMPVGAFDIAGCAMIVVMVLLVAQTDEDEGSEAHEKREEGGEDGETHVSLRLSSDRQPTEPALPEDGCTE